MYLHWDWVFYQARWCWIIDGYMGPREVMSCFSYNIIHTYYLDCIYRVILREANWNNDVSWISNKLLEYKIYICEEEILREMYPSQLVCVGLFLKET